MTEAKIRTVQRDNSLAVAYIGEIGAQQWIVFRCPGLAVPTTLSTPFLLALAACRAFGILLMHQLLLGGVATVAKKLRFKVGGSFAHGCTSAAVAARAMVAMSAAR